MSGQINLTTNILVNTLTQSKIVYLPANSTIGGGRTFFIKDICGNAGNSSIRISTTGLDTFDNKNRDNFSFALLSTNFGSITLASDGILNWMILQHYFDNVVKKTMLELPLSLVPSLRYSFLAGYYFGGSSVNNIGSNSGIGPGTVVKNSFTATSPGFITNVRASNYVLGASVANFRTIIMITKIRDTASPSYFLDARPGTADGWIYDNFFGSGWGSPSYYKDTLSLPLTLPGGANDSQWHHHCIIAPSPLTSAITFANRFSQNEGMGCDIAEIMVFTQALSLNEIKTNFNFFATRFGFTPVALTAAPSATTFTATSNYQTYTVPPGASSVYVVAWGAGGSSFNGYNGPPGVGGGGACVKGYLPVTAGETLRIIVGVGGLNDQSGINPTDAMGGGGQGRGGGGGRTAIQRVNGTDLFVVGGGGGGGIANGDIGGAATASGTAFRGNSGSQTTTSDGQNGGGGSQTEGGAGANTAGSGSLGKGGSSGVGAGGGGWYGGGGGFYYGSGSQQCAGGGGSSMTSNLSGTGLELFNGSGRNPGNSSDPLRINNAGYGGDLYSQGGHGILYIYT